MIHWLIMKDNILIYAIDDSTFQLAVLEKGFSEHYKNVTLRTFLTFKGLQEAIEYEEPDCCIIDLIMPYVSGIYVLEWLDKFYPKIKKFINSSCNSDEYKVMSKFRYKIPFLDKESDIDSRIKIIFDELSTDKNEANYESICS